VTSATLSLRLTSERKRQQNLALIRETFEAAGIVGLTDAEIDHMAWVAWYFVIQWGENTLENWVRAIRLVLDICGAGND
jgi:hypothetical protein